MKYKVVNKKILLVGVLLLLSLGYALLSANLTINGNSKLANSTWDIHFDNVVPKEGRVSVREHESEAVINPNDNTEVTYNVTLSKPGDFYEFNVDIVNAGSIDGQVERINSRLKIGDDEAFVITDNPSNLPPYLTYSITYADDSEIIPNHLLKSGNSETIKVRVEFKRDIDSSILPEDDIDITLTIQPDLIQKNDDAIEEVDDNAPVVNSCTYEGELVQGAEYTNGEYTYRYMQEYVGIGWSNVADDGWGVTLTDKSSTSSVTTNLCTTINDKPIVSMSKMFAGSQASSINTRFNTSSVRNMSGMFSGCSNVEELDLSSFNTGNVSDMSDMFYETDNLVEIKLPVNFIPNAVDRVYLDEMFYDENGHGMNYINRNINSDAPVTIQKKYSLTIENEGMVETTTYSGMYKKGTSITLRAKEQDGLVFTGWSNGETTKEITFVLTEDTTINPIYNYNNVAVFTNGYYINQIMKFAADIQEIDSDVPIDPGPPMEINKDDVLYTPPTVGNNDSLSLKHFERSDTLIQDIESIVSNMNIEITEEEIDDFMIINHIDDRDYARKILLHRKKIDLLGDYLISSDVSGYDIYGWFDADDDTYYYYTETDDIFLNDYSREMFAGLYDLEDYNGLKEVNTYSTRYMESMFYGCSSITHLDLGSFDLSSVEETRNFLAGAKSILEVTTPKALFSRSGIEIDLNSVFLDNENKEYAVINSNTPSRIKIEKEKTAVFDVGMKVNYKMKILAGNSEVSMDEPEPISYSPKIEQTVVSASYNPSSNYLEVVDENIEKIIKANSLPNDFEESDENTLSTLYSYYPIYAWYDENEKTIYYYTEAEKIYFNQDSSYMFNDMRMFTDISGVTNVDFSRVKYIFEMFSNCSLLETIDMSNWDFSGIIYVDNYGGSNPEMDGDIVTSSNPMVSQEVYGSGENNLDNSSYSMFLNDYYLRTIITPKKMFSDDRITISLDANFEDSNHNNYYFLDKNTPSNVQFSSLKRVVLFNPNGGFVDSDIIITTIGSSIEKLPDPVSYNEDFLGWYTGIDGGILIDDGYVVENDITLFAKWGVAEYYTVTFDKNNENATGVMSDVLIKEFTRYNLKSNAYSLDGYIFAGWNTESNGSGRSYNDEQEFYLYDDLTLYAQWIKLYTLTFDKNNNNATGEVYAYSVPSGASTPIDDEAFKNYELLQKEVVSWNTKSDYTGITYYPNQNISITEDTILYAKWGKPKLSERIYWALQDNDADNINETLVFSSEEVNGNYDGSISTNSADSSYATTPWVNNGRGENVNEIKVEKYIVPSRMNGWFTRDLGCNSTSIDADLDKIYTANITSMSRLFDSFGYDFTDFSLDLNAWDVSNVESFGMMFYQTGYNATTFDLDIDNWDTRKAISMSEMFYLTGRNALSFNVDLTNLHTSNVKYMDSMFRIAGDHATNWSIGDISGWNTSKVTDMSNMFESAGILLETFNLDLSGWDVSSVTDFKYMFYNTGFYSTSFSLDLSGWNMLHVTDSSKMFYNVGYNSNTFNINISDWKTESLTDMSWMFHSSGKEATTWDIEGISDLNVGNVTDMSYLFSEAGYSATTIDIGDLGDWDVSSVINMSHMFDYFGYEATTWTIGDISEWNIKNATNLSYMFGSAGANATVFSLDLGGWDTSNVTDMSGLFSGAGMNATTWNLGGIGKWNTSKVTDMSYMFCDVGSNLTTFNLDLSDWDTSKVTKINGLFFISARNVETLYIDISGWDTSSVEDMSSMLNYTGENATSWTIIIPKTNCNGINNTSSRFYGKTLSVYVSPPTGRQFTVAS